MQRIANLISARTLVLAAAAAVLVAGLAPGPVEAEPQRQPVVVELFTSQGCSSCPPADAFLGELAKQQGVIALSMHVDYWDYIGWKDPYASADMTKRQRDYSRHLKRRYIYTPQMVIDGRHEAVGSSVLDVRRLIDQSAAQRKPLDLRYEDENGGKVLIPAGHAPDGGAVVWLATFDDAHETDVLSGENQGRKLRYSHVVRDLEQIGTWNGVALEIPLNLDAAAARGRDGCAVIVQQGRTGPILGALQMDLTAGN